MESLKLCDGTARLPRSGCRTDVKSSAQQASAWACHAALPQQIGKSMDAPEMFAPSVVVSSVARDDGAHRRRATGAITSRVEGNRPRWLRLAGGLPLLPMMRRIACVLMVGSMLYAEAVAQTKSVNEEQYLTTKWFLEVAQDKDPKIRQIIERKVADIEDGLSWANVYLVSRQQPQIYCLPGQLALTGPQLVDIVRRQVAKQPEDAKYPIGLVLREALQSVFPCPTR